MLKSRLNPITFSEFTPQSQDEPQEPLGKTKSSRPLTFVLERRLKFKMYMGSTFAPTFAWVKFTLF